MPPRSLEHHDASFMEDDIVDRASYELEAMRNSDEQGVSLQPLPTACHEMIKSLPGNLQCIDCGANHPDWATVSYGALVCLSCCARHRSLGVQYSKVRSLTMDHWSHAQVLKMLEGGNCQLRNFFSRHALGCSGNNGDANLRKRYMTKAAKFYRDGIEKHVSKVVRAGMYRGREASRRLPRSRSEILAQAQCS